MANAKKVGQLIKKARTEAGLTQEQLARKVRDCSASDVGRAERGEKELTAEQNAAYAHIEDELRSVQRPRPTWDMTLLADAGFRDFRVDRDVYCRIYREKDRFFNPTPIFCITARK